jgi:hypothetical protein
MTGVFGYSWEAGMQYGIRVGVGGLAVALLTAGCAADTPQGFAAPPTGAAGTPVAGPATPGREPPPVTAQEAQATALEELGGGWILETTIEGRDDDRDDDDRDDDDWFDDDDDFEADVDVWEVTVVGSDGLRRTVSVDLTGGSVLDSRVDD